LSVLSKGELKKKEFKDSTAKYRVTCLQRQRSKPSGDLLYLLPSQWHVKDSEPPTIPSVSSKPAQGGYQEHAQKVSVWNLTKPALSPPSLPQKGLHPGKESKHSNKQP